MSLPDASLSTCGSCGEALWGAARFCPACGQPVALPPATEVRKEVTLVFCDVTGSTALGEQLDPEALRAVMGRYFSVVSAAVERHGGLVEKFVGDAVLAVFGIPEVREDDALRAVRAAAEVRDGLADLSDELRASMQVELSVRTGVNTGSVVAGAARAGGSFATGDAVNTAARLEQSAAPGDVLLGAATWSLVRDAVEVEPVEPIVVKGKSEPLRAFRLVRVLDSERGRNRRPDAELVGRDREVRALEDALARTLADARGQLITVLGVAGIGKTRLVEHFLAQLTGDIRVLRGRCLSYGRGITFWPVLQLLRQAAGLSGEESDEEGRQALAALLIDCPEAEAVLERVLPLLGLGGEPGGTEETSWAVRSVFEHLAAQRPTVVVVDDIHWAEPTLLDLLERVRDEARDVPLMLVCQARPELLEQRPAWGGGAINATTFSLEPLTGSQTRFLLDGLLGKGVPDEVVDAVGRWADGNPLFVEEVATHLVEEGVLQRADEGWRVVGDLSRAQVPAGVNALLVARLDRLPAAERELLERVSVVGLEVTLAEAAALSPQGTDVAGLLASLGRRDLLRRTRGARADTWAFRHVLLREAAYGALPKSARADLHERFADRLEQQGRDAGGEVAAFVGHHLEQAVRYGQELTPGAPAVADLADRAARALEEAAEHARSVEDIPAVLGLADRALDLVREPAARRRLLWLRFDVLVESGLLDQARATLDELGRAELGPAEQALVVAQDLVLRSYATESIDPADLAAAADRAATLALEAGDVRARSRALAARIPALMIRGRWAAVRQAAEELVRVGAAEERRQARYALIASYCWGPSTVREGLAVLTAMRAQPLPPMTQAFVKVTEATMRSATGDAAAALALIDEADAAARGRDLMWPVNAAFCTYAVHVASGELDAAMAAVQDGIDTARKGGTLAYASTLLAEQAAILLQLGDDERARAVVEEAAEVTSPYDAMSVGLVAAGRAVLAARAADHDEAAVHLTASMEAMDATDQTNERADLRRMLSEVPARRGDIAGQRRLLTEAIELYDEKGNTTCAQLTRQLLAQVPGA